MSKLFILYNIIKLIKQSPKRCAIACTLPIFEVLFVIHRESAGGEVEGGSSRRGVGSG
jgi:hypothetical protein